MNVDLGSKTREQEELITIKSLTFRMKCMEIAGMRKGQGRRGEWGEVGNELEKCNPYIS